VLIKTYDFVHRFFISNKKAVFVNFFAIYKRRSVVDFRSRMLAFRGAGGEPPQALSLWGLTFPLLPQESRTFRSNQIFYQRIAFHKTYNKKE
jgi:hypothetical protein